MGNPRGGLQSGGIGIPAGKEIDLGFLSPGEAFGLGALYDSLECPYVASSTIRVDSDVARVLVLTQRSLLYLPDILVTSVLEVCKGMVDPARPSVEAIRAERKQHHRWHADKHKVLMQEMTSAYKRKILLQDMH